MGGAFRTKAITPAPRTPVHVFKLRSRLRVPEPSAGHASRCSGDADFAAPILQVGLRFGLAFAAGTATTSPRCPNPGWPRSQNRPSRGCSGRGRVQWRRSARRFVASVAPRGAGGRRFFRIPWPRPGRTATKRSPSKRVRLAVGFWRANDCSRHRRKVRRRPESKCRLDVPGCLLVERGSELFRDDRHSLPPGRCREDSASRIKPHLLSHGLLRVISNPLQASFEFSPFFV